MRFTKMHGAGNDYVYVDCFETPLVGDLANIARRVSDRHRGVGADGLILIHRSEHADGRMQMFNADGSEAEMCGNGLRCVAKYLYDHRGCTNEELTIETGAGNRRAWPLVEQGAVSRVRLDMGAPALDAGQVPTTLPGAPVVRAPVDAGGQSLLVTCLSMGNPHSVLFVDQLDDALVEGVGPELEHHGAFPQRTNVEFVEVLSRDSVRQRTWERGSGETHACGTGAAAVCVAGVLNGLTDRAITVQLLGGNLELEWRAEDNRVYLTGPAAEVFVGEWPDERD